MKYDSIDSANVGAGNPRTLADELENPLSESAPSVASLPSNDPVRQLTDSEDGFYDEGADEVVCKPSHTEARKSLLDSELFLEDSSLCLSPEHMTKEESQQFPKPDFDWATDAEENEALPSEERAKRRMRWLINKIRKLDLEIEDLQSIGKKTDAIEVELTKFEKEMDELQNAKETLDKAENKERTEELEKEVDESDSGGEGEDGEDSQGSEDGWEGDDVECAGDESLYQTDAHFSRPAWVPSARATEATDLPASPSPPPTPSSPFSKQEKLANFSLKRSRPRGPPRLRWKRLKWSLWLEDAAGELNDNDYLVEMYSSWYGEYQPNARGSDFQRPSGPSILRSVKHIDQGFSPSFGFSSGSSKRRAMSLPYSPKSKRVTFARPSDSKQIGNAKNVLFRELREVMALPRLHIPKDKRPAPRQLSREHDPIVNWEDTYSPSHDSEYESEPSPDPAEVVAGVDKWIDGVFGKGDFSHSPREGPSVQLKQAPRRRGRKKRFFFASPVRPKFTQPQPLPYYPGSRLPIPTKVGPPAQRRSSLSPPAVPAKSRLRARLGTKTTQFCSELRKEIEPEDAKNTGKEMALADPSSRYGDIPLPGITIVDAASPTPEHSPSLPVKEPIQITAPQVSPFRLTPRRALHASPEPVQPPPPEALLRAAPTIVRRERNTFQDADLMPLERFNPSCLSTRVHVVIPYLFTTPKELPDEQPRASTSSLSTSVSTLDSENSRHSVEMPNQATKAEAPALRLFGWFRRK